MVRNAVPCIPNVLAHPFTFPTVDKYGAGDRILEQDRLSDLFTYMQFVLRGLLTSAESLWHKGPKPAVVGKV